MTRDRKDIEQTTPPKQKEKKEKPLKISDTTQEQTKRKRKIEQEENIQNEDIKQTTPPKKKEKKEKPRKVTGKTAFIKGLVSKSTLDVVTALYKNTLTQQQKEDIVKKNLTEEEVGRVSTIALEGDWNCPEEADANIFKHLLSSFGINLRNDRELSKERTEIVEQIKEFITQFLSTHNVDELNEQFKKIGLNINKRKIDHFLDEYKLCTTLEIIHKSIDFTIQKQILSAIVPSFRKTKSKSEMELTRQFFGPLFEFTTLFDNCFGGSNTSIKEFTFKSSVSDNVKTSLPDFHPDDFTFVKYGNFECIKLIQEDSKDSYKHHTLHKDFVPLITQMQLCLAFNMRQLLRDPVENWQEQCVLGVTGELYKCNAYLLRCQPSITSSKGTELFYYLSYLGSFDHFNIKHRITLVSLLISNLCFPKIETIENMVTTKVPTKFKITSPNKNVVRDFPNTVYSNGIMYDVNYQEMETKMKNNLRYCKINNIDCVIKRGKETCKCLSLIVIKEEGFTVSLKGECLADMLNMDSEIDVEGLFFDILCILDIFSTKGVTHNDIKPENIVKYENRWFLIDFETRRKFKTYDENRKCFLTADGLLCTCSSYSKGYRSPERIAQFEFNGAKFTGRVSPQSDLYSFGLVMLEVLENERIREMETRDIVELKLKDLHIKNEIIKKYLPQMLEIDFEKRPTSRELLEDSINEQEERINEGIEFFSNTNNYTSRLFPKPKLKRAIKQKQVKEK